LVTDIYRVTAMGLCNRCSVTVPNAQPRNAVPERSERLPKPGTGSLGRLHLLQGLLELGGAAACRAVASTSTFVVGAFHKSTRWFGVWRCPLREPHCGVATGPLLYSAPKILYTSLRRFTNLSFCSLTCCGGLNSYYSYSVWSVLLLCCCLSVCMVCRSP